MVLLSLTLISLTGSCDSCSQKRIFPRVHIESLLGPITAWTKVLDLTNLVMEAGVPFDFHHIRRTKNDSQEINFLTTVFSDWKDYYPYIKGTMGIGEK